MMLLRWIRIATVLLMFSVQAEAIELFITPGVGFFGDPEGSWTDVEVEGDIISVKMNLAKDTRGGPNFITTWSSEVWSSVTLLRNKTSGDPAAVVSFDPFQRSGSTPPLLGEPVVLPPKVQSELHYDLVLFSAGDIINCDDEFGDVDALHCEGYAEYDYEIAEVEPPIMGDVNFDGVVDFADFLVVSENYSRFQSNLTTWYDGDMTLDGRVNLEDFLSLSANYGAVREAAAVPEPSAIMLLVMSGFLATQPGSRREDARNLRQ